VNNRTLIAVALAVIALAGGLYLILRLLAPVPISVEPAPLSRLLAGQEKKVVPMVTSLVKSGERESDLSFSLMQRLAETYRGRAVFRSIDVEKEPDMARAYQYQSLPLTVIMAPSGKVVYRHEGYVDEEVILEKLKAAGME
jgi:hypothetical protein